MLLFVIVLFPYSKIYETAVVLVIVDLIQRSIQPIKEVASKVSNIQRAISGIERVHEFLQDLSELKCSPIVLSTKERNFDSLEVKIDEFEYSSRKETEEVFRVYDISFTALRGEIIGVLGRSGSGKTTFLNILRGSVIPKEFEIKILNSEDEINYSNKKLENSLEYKTQVGIVSQDSHVFSESLLFNLTFGREIEGKPFVKFWQWVKEEIPYLKYWDVQLEMPIIPNKLSLGQKQLISAIRSCYLEKKIVLFDEISSGLDSFLEESLQKVIRIIQKNSLTFIVAHRLETILESNRLILMEKGTIIELGSHRELLVRSKSYQKIIKELES